MIMTPLGLAKEERLEIPVEGLRCLVISGYATFAGMEGDEDDDYKDVSYSAHMVVGPNWLNVRDVSPIVTRAGFSHPDSDEADATGYEIKSCTWDTVGNPAPDTDSERIRLKVELEVKGGGFSHLTKLAYHLVATGNLAPS
jgi:hypothetical protein